ncbi:hypothetical protein AMK21_01460 [Streptomyces sp. CB00316]|uniref:hypothetical protein n=1 Tax=unclassified Streptomyces TaxID=2593676 RepID=UPI0007D9C4B2|nr:MULTISPECIES: hypothetical protein [unclassified Streptomyces]OAL57877.1 hypothetical protein A6R74_21475 [Halomonas sp. ALS9]MBT2377311.1 hypothetical protein [Streptomyces sp. ISL-111]MBT2425476.1 hypothetical protein [Streptomyces sp. ISL-112]MBT2465710.1 hypothetical protein [Streptomyces sp. ISL-63]OKJ23670.1 hypothetical protein AMK21_01460 [Streptomyces sp. CB00316]
MAFIKRVALAPRAVRQLRRVRSVYLGGMVLSLLGLVLQLDRDGGGRQTEITAVLLVAFAALFGLTVVQLWRHTRTSHCSTAKRLTPSL